MPVASRHAAWSLPAEGRSIEFRRGVTLVQLPAFADNYFYLLHDTASGRCAVIDPGNAAPVENALNARGGTLSDIFLTHHHDDHTGGVAALVAAHGCRVTGNAEDAGRLPCITNPVNAGDRVGFGALEMDVLPAAGHTTGHILYAAGEAGWLFCGDTLFGMGCGRLFEGTPQQMFDSIGRIKSLADAMLVCCAHEYTARNAAFALHAMPDNPEIAERAEQANLLAERGQPTIPSRLGEEKRSNPFMLAESVEEFTRLRALRDRF